VRVVICRIQPGSEVYHTLKSVIAKKYGRNATNVGDEGGFAPDIEVSNLVKSVMTHGAGNEVRRKNIQRKLRREPGAVCKSLLRIWQDPAEAAKMLMEAIEQSGHKGKVGSNTLRLVGVPYQSCHHGYSRRVR
jgi:hypothetical protein